MSTANTIRLWGLIYALLIGASMLVQSYASAAFLFYLGTALILARIAELLERHTTKRHDTKEGE